MAYAPILYLTQLLSITLPQSKVEQYTMTLEGQKSSILISLIMMQSMVQTLQATLSELLKMIQLMTI